MLVVSMILTRFGGPIAVIVRSRVPIIVDSFIVIITSIINGFIGGIYQYYYKKLQRN